MPINDNIVFLAKGAASYDQNHIDALLASLFRDAGWDKSHETTSSWNPLGDIVKPGDIVLIKPNWVFHSNGKQDLQCLVTQTELLRGILKFLVRTSARRIIIGDSPVQSCDFNKLIENTGCNKLIKEFREWQNIEWVDFRRTVMENSKGVWKIKSDLRPLDKYLLYDLGRESVLEEIGEDSEKFRVTCYNPNLMRETHLPGKHQYLICREAIEANVIINVPKLKTHKKAGITGALKNLVGVNGNKDYLPHHRYGGSKTGGDCYPGNNVFKRAYEFLSDASNRCSGRRAYLLRQLAQCAYVGGRLTGAGPNIEGSWHGNDTVWRMVLDLNRIIFYGKNDGFLAEKPQRTVLTLTDGIIGGQGEGPLSPTPIECGVLTMALNPAAAEIAHAAIMGFDWRKIPLLREAFRPFKYPLCEFAPSEIELVRNGARVPKPWPTTTTPFSPPRGWKGNCELC